MNKTTTALKVLNTREVCSHHFFTTGESAISYQTACGFVVSFYLIIIQTNKTWIIKKEWKAVIRFLTQECGYLWELRKGKNICFHVKALLLPPILVLGRESHWACIRSFFTALKNLACSSLLFGQIYHFFCCWYCQPTKSQKIQKTELGNLW